PSVASPRASWETQRGFYLSIGVVPQSPAAVSEIWCLILLFAPLAHFRGSVSSVFSCPLPLAFVVSTHSPKNEKRRGMVPRRSGSEFFLLKDDSETRTDPQLVINRTFFAPKKPSIGEKTGCWVESVFQSYPAAIGPLIDRAYGAPAASKNVGRKPAVTD